MSLIEYMGMGMVRMGFEHIGNERGKRVDLCMSSSPRIVIVVSTSSL